jgi:geranylgeranyl pyrophosphate synthase/predicted secreted hydrolase
MRNVPSDWPHNGPIDLDRHDPPHRSSDTEWWYVNAHFESLDGRKLSLFAAFFRIVAARDEQTGERKYAHSVTWALTDETQNRYYPASLVDERAPEMGLERIRNGAGAKDPRLNRAMTELLEQGHVPLPDRMFTAPVHVDMKKLDLDFGGARFFKQEDGSYRLKLENPHEHVGCDLTFRLLKQPIRHGEDGVVRGKSGEDMFYYFVPRCGLEGTVTLEGRAQPVQNGRGWYDHEFGGHMRPSTPVLDAAPPASLDAGANIQDMAWNWTAIQLDDGSELSGYEVVESKSSDVVNKWLLEIGANGERKAVPNFELTPGRAWRSTRTFQEYPVSFVLRCAELELDLTLDASVEDQELITVISHPAFWEGRCKVRGTHRGREVTGLAFLERSGFSVIDTLDRFFTEVGKEVMKSVSEVIPLDPTYEQMRELIASEERDHYMRGVDLPSMTQNLIKPIREITDRGGKSWRSYAALACCDVVGGDSRKFVQWLAMPELMHVGSLIVDDVQDRSDVRRGGKCVHHLYGEPVAINAGTAAYFITHNLLMSSDLSPAKKLALYDLYFQAMRTGHAGQAIDHGGMADLMPHAVESGDAEALEQRILACYRLKTAVPAASLAQMGAVAGGGTEAQCKAVGDFFEQLGLAFQIIDDVLNLRGFKGDLKTRGEDIMNGLVTLPVARALTVLDKAEREELWATIQSKPRDLSVVSATVEKLERCGAIEACAELAKKLVEESWQRCELLLEPSSSKVMLRAFGWFVLERHY